MDNVQSDLNESSDFKSEHWKKLSPSWKITSDLWGSPLDIRNLGTQYLRKFAKEPQAKYDERKSQSVFQNEFRSSIEMMGGMVFRTDPEPDDVDPAIDELFDDIDLCGNSFWAFTLNAFEMFLRDGNGFIYVDAPPLSEAVAEKVAAGVAPTLRDRQDDRPFWVFYHACQVINYRFEKIGSRPVLVQVTIKEEVCEPAGTFGEVEVVQHRVLRPGSYEVWRQDPVTEKFTILHESGLTGMDKITLIPLAEFNAKPPMLTLGMLNVQHYNQTSDYDDICHLVCTPQQVRKYESSDDAKKAADIATASPGTGIKMWGPNSNVFYVEVSGTGLDHARQRYQDIEQQMAKIGVGMLAPADQPAGVRTATEVMDTAGQRQSKLSNLARQFENAFEKALYLTAEYINAIKGPKTINLDDAEETVKMRLKIDYERLTFSLDQLLFFSDLVDSGKLSLMTFLQWLPQVADMPPGFDPAEELKRIAAVNTIVTEPPPSKTPPGKMPPEDMPTED